MKKYLLPQTGKFYKANLHTHTTVSDGEMTPEEIKTAYMAEGYSIVAYTDHEVMVAHEDLTDENFLAITSVEFALNQPSCGLGFALVKSYHFNLYAKDPKAVKAPGFCERGIWLPQSRQYVTDEMRSAQDYPRIYAPEYINSVIDRAAEQGFLVSFNHPVWSLHDYTDYSEIRGLWGIEIYNTGSANLGLPDTVQPLEDLLRKGERVYPLAADDTHSPSDCFGGFVMVKAENLQYSTVMTALEKGDFYASTGAKIEEISIENGLLKIVCPNAASVFINTDCRTTKRKVAEKGESFDEAEFDLNDYLELAKKAAARIGTKPFIRVTVKNAEGKTAHSRAYFLEELI